MQERTFSFKESCELLQINPKSFQEWLKKAGIDPNAQVDKFDPRKKYLTHKQLIMLAEAHGRVLPPLRDGEQPTTAVVSNEKLADQLAALQQEHAQQFEQINLLLAQLTRQVQDIATQQCDFQQQLTQAPTATKEHPDSVTHNGHSPDTIKRPLQETSSPTLSKASTAQLQAKRSPKRPSKKTRRSKKFPAGLVLLRDFAGKHHVVTERASHAGASGKIKIVQGKWLVNSRWATEALDAQGQHDFYKVFHQHEKFQRCERCPHVSYESSK